MIIFIPSGFPFSHIYIYIRYTHAIISTSFVSVLWLISIDFSSIDDKWNEKTRNKNGTKREKKKGGWGCGWGLVVYEKTLWNGNVVKKWNWKIDGKEVNGGDSSHIRIKMNQFTCLFLSVHTHVLMLDVRWCWYTLAVFFYAFHSAKLNRPIDKCSFVTVHKKNAQQQFSPRLRSGERSVVNIWQCVAYPAFVLNFVSSLRYGA